jgi:hypothetical protein
MPPYSWNKIFLALPDHENGYRTPKNVRKYLMCGIWGSHSSAVEDSGLLEYYTISTASPDQGKGMALLCNISNYVPVHCVLKHKMQIFINTNMKTSNLAIMMNSHPISFPIPHHAFRTTSLLQCLNSGIHILVEERDFSLLANVQTGTNFINFHVGMVYPI